ncbi:MAG: DUF6034 family protein [Clostridium sp.]|nr:DUF6034 family protein [Clostridium sp.]MCM1208893.1 DUF6034 family protein [Ruminococcus sp.]
MMKQNCERRYTLKNMALISALIILTGIFTACGRSSKEDIAKDLSGNVTAATKSDAAQEAIPQSLSYTVESRSGGKIKVEAELYADGYGQVPTYKLKRKDKDDAWVKAYAEKLFDNGDYINVKPYAFCSREELEAEKQFWEERLADLEDDTDAYEHVESRIARIEWEMDNLKDNAVEYPKDQFIFTEEFYYPEDNSTTFYNNALLRGEIDKDVWLLEYDYVDYEADIQVDQPALYGSCPEKQNYINNSYGMDLGIYKNKCDRAEAEREAELFLDKLGFHNMSCVKMTEIQPVSEGKVKNGADYLDGYGIVYAPYLNGINMFSDVGEGVSVNDGITAVQPYVIICVNSKGVYSFCIMEDYEIEETLSENSQMLSFQQIDDIAHTHFDKLLEEYPSTQYDITKVNFEYVCVAYDENSYAMLPVWVYYSEFIVAGDTMLDPVLIINALDGALISSEYVHCSWEYYSIMQ